MKSYLKYIRVSKTDKQWGGYLHDAGHLIRNPGAKPQPHPDAYKIPWTRGRILHEYQFIYLVRGKGEFESRSFGKSTVGEGDFIILFPGEWHRYRPDARTGWDSYFAGGNGILLDHLVQASLLSKFQPIHSVGYDAYLVDTFIRLIDTIHEEQSGYQQIAFGILWQLLGTFYALKNKVAFAGNEQETRLQKACMIYTEYIHHNITPEEIARQINMSYSLFRKSFKIYTGFSPADYFLELKIQKAKELLMQTGEAVKSIALDLGFANQEHFCKVFKRKTGMAPGRFRER